MPSSKNEKSLQDWKLPPSSPSDSFKRRGIFHCFSSDRTVKTVEREIRLSEGISSIPLITDIPRRSHRNKCLLHVGMVQVALKPLKLGSDTSAVICLRDRRILNFNYSVLAMVESGLCDGPIYFSYFPSHSLSMSDPYLRSTFVVDVETRGSVGVILMFRFHYKVTESVWENPKKKPRNLVDGMEKTTLFVTDVARGNSVVSKEIYRDQVSVPEVWKVRSDSPSSFAAAGEQVAAASVPIDWKEAAEAHVLKVDVPGLKKEEIRVEVEDGEVLQISGERRKEVDESEKWHCVERSSGKFVRRLKLPDNVSLEGVRAAVENGVLTVTVPKMEANKKMVKVKVIDVEG